MWLEPADLCAMLLGWGVIFAFFGFIAGFAIGEAKEARERLRFIESVDDARVKFSERKMFSPRDLDGIVKQTLAPLRLLADEWEHIALADGSMERDWMARTAYLVCASELHKALAGESR